jgi:hypothetical protein
MDKSLKLFIIGFIVGLIVALVPTPGDVDTDNSNLAAKQIFAGGFTIWKSIYFAVLVVMLPFLVVEPLKNRLKVKQLFPLQFIVGNSCAMGIVTLIFTVSTLF